MRRLLLIAAANAACATATRITTDPPGALLYVNGSFVGTTPVVYPNDKGLPRRYHFEVRHPGCDPLDFYVDTKLSYVWGVLGAIAVVPYLWAWSLDSEYELVLQGPRQTCRWDEQEWLEEEARARERERRRLRERYDEEEDEYGEEDDEPPPRRRRRP